ncbi:MAG: BlaI/MecI/CopY family transcriptional regulator [Eubacteriales bacterium]
MTNVEFLYILIIGNYFRTLYVHITVKGRFCIMKKKGRIAILPGSEFQVMQIIWDMARENDGDCTTVTAGAMFEFAPGQIGHLKLTTILTLINRLVAKGFVRTEKIGRANCCIPLVSEEEYRQNAASNFVETVYKNDTKSLISALLGREKLSRGDIDEIRALMSRPDTDTDTSK